MIIEKLTEAEEIVMKAIWDCKKEPGLSEVVKRVKSIYGRDWKSPTVSTFFARLVRKGYIEMQKNGKVYTYKILVNEQEYNREQLRRLYIFLYRNDKESMKRDLAKL